MRLALDAHASSPCGSSARSSWLRSLVAAAAVAGSTAAWADQTLTFYGIIDMGLVKADVGTTPGAMLPGYNSNAETYTLKAGNTSRLGIRAQRDFDSDRYARFQVEHRFALDTGGASNTNVFWLGRSVVAVGSKKWGEVYAGREYSPAYTVALNADPTYWSYVSQTGSVYTYANYTPVASTIEASNIRWANAVGYKSPTLSGLSAEVATALGEGQRRRSTAANLQYKLGAAWAAAGWDQLNSTTNLRLVAAGYDFGVVFPKASYSKARGGINGDAKAYTLSAAVPLPFGRTFLSYGSIKPAASGTDASMVGAGLQYDLDKETLLYVNAGRSKREGRTPTAAVDVGVKYTF